jgi:hypothetical protein
MALDAEATTERHLVSVHKDDSRPERSTALAKAADPPGPSVSGNPAEGMKNPVTTATLRALVKTSNAEDMRQEEQSLAGPLPERFDATKATRDSNISIIC